MKKLLYHFLPIFLLFVGFSCTNDKTSDTKANNVEPFKINNLELDLSLNLKSYNDVYFKTANLPNFLEKYSGELYENNTFYIASYQNYTVVRISSDAYEVQVAAYNAKTSPKNAGNVNYTTCRNANCVAKTIKDAIGDRSKTVYLSVKPVKTLGVKTGVQVGSSSHPIAQQEVAMLTELDLADAINNENRVNIDGILTAP